MIRVGVIGDSLEIGGQERGLLEVLRRLDRRDFAPHLYLFRPGALLDEVRELGVPLAVGHDKPGAIRAWTKADDAARIAWSTRLAQLLRRDRIDVALIYAWSDGIDAALSAGVRAIVERLDGPGLAAKVRDKSACARVICESRLGRDVALAQKDLLGCRSGQIVIIPNGVDLARFDPRRYDRARCRAALGLSAGDFVIGSVARLSPEKNLAQLLDAIRFAITRSRGASRVRAVIAGPDRGDGERLRAAAERLGIADRVRFLGARSDVPEVLCACDAYVLCSLVEGTPFALLEAMAMGLPVVANQVGAVTEVIRGNGFLTPVLHPEETGWGLIRLLEDPELARRLGRRSRQIAVRRYDVERMIGRYQAVLLEALDASAEATAGRRFEETESRTLEDRAS